MSEIKNRLKVLRTGRGLTQEELAKKAHIAKSKLISVEKGCYDNLKFKEMKLLAKILGSTIEELFLGDD